MVFLMAAGRCREPLAQSLGGQQSFNKSQSVLCHYINIFGQLLWRSGGAGSHHIPSYASTGETSGAANPWKWNQKTRSFSLVYLQALRIFYMHEKKSGNPISRCETTVQEHKDTATITSFFFGCSIVKAESAGSHSITTYSPMFPFNKGSENENIIFCTADGSCCFLTAGI